jgi:hypothetical protein
MHIDPEQHWGAAELAESLVGRKAGTGAREKADTRYPKCRHAVELAPDQVATNGQRRRIFSDVSIWMTLRSCSTITTVP